MDRAHELESRMVTGEVAFLAARLFALESRRQINRVNDRLGEALDMIEEMKTLITEHEETIGSLVQRVQDLEREGRMRRRGRQRVRRSSGSSGGPSTSTGDTSYGSPRLLAGMVGDGIEEPYRLVLAEPVEPEVVVREEPVTPVIPPAPLEEVEREVIVISDDEGEGLQGRLDRNFARWIAAGNSPSGRRSSSPEVQEIPPPVREGDNPPSYRSLSPAPPTV